MPRSTAAPTSASAAIATNHAEIEMIVWSATISVPIAWSTAQRSSSGLATANAAAPRIEIAVISRPRQYGIAKRRMRTTIATEAGIRNAKRALGGAAAAGALTGAAPTSESSSRRARRGSLANGSSLVGV